MSFLPAVLPGRREDAPPPKPDAGIRIVPLALVPSTAEPVDENNALAQEPQHAEQTSCAVDVVTSAQAKSRRVTRIIAALSTASTNFALAWVLPIALIVAWHFCSQWQLVPEVLLPAPTDVFATLTDLLRNGDIAAGLAISMQRVFFGFAAGAALGLLLGVLMGVSPTFKDYAHPAIYLFAQVPLLGWLPLLMLVVGIGEALKIVLVAKAVFVPVALNTLSGLESVPASYIEVARVFRFSRYQLLRQVVLPSALPPIWNGLRFGLTKAWLALVGVELLASSEGLGFMIVNGRQLMQLDVVLSAVIVVGLVGWLLDKMLSLIESYLLRWRRDGF